MINIHPKFIKTKHGYLHKYEYVRYSNLFSLHLCLIHLLHFVQAVHRRFHIFRCQFCPLWTFPIHLCSEAILSGSQNDTSIPSSFCTWCSVLIFCLLVHNNSQCAIFLALSRSAQWPVPILIKENNRFGQNFYPLPSFIATSSAWMSRPLLVFFGMFSGWLSSLLLLLVFGFVSGC